MSKENKPLVTVGFRLDPDQEKLLTIAAEIYGLEKADFLRKLVTDAITEIVTPATLDELIAKQEVSYRQKVDELQFARRLLFPAPED